MVWLRELRHNPGLLPKLLVLIYRCGYFIYFKVHIPVVRQLLYLIYRLVDLLFVKLLLNCDLPGSAKIGPGLTIYHPYGILINDSSVIGHNFIVRAQVTIGNKGTGGEACPQIGDNVEVGTGAKIIGGIQIGDDTTIGTNAVVTKSFRDHSVLVGVPAHDIATHE